MAIRDKIKAKLSSKSKRFSLNPPPKDEPIPGHYTGRTDIEYYKPNEIPKSKYRGRVDPDHQEKLDAFSFGDAFQQIMRRSSTALSGTFSPGGTKAFSRRTSYASHIQTPARSRRSSLSSDANASFSVPSSASDSTHMSSVPSTSTPVDVKGNAEAEAPDTGISKDTNIPMIKLDRQATIPEKQADLSQNHIENSRPSSEMPFTPEELTQAMTRVTITPQVTARRTSMAIV